MKNFFKNKNMLIGVLLTIVFVMAIGFAGFAQNLQISDTASSTNTWNVYISNAELASNSPNATGSVTKAQGLEATFVTTLHSPGDTVVYNVTVTNEGSVDATLDELSLNTTNNDSVIKYSSSGIAKGDTLAQSESKTFTVTVEYDSTKTGTATEAQKSNSATLQLNFVQKTISGTVTPSETITTSELKNSVVTSGDGLYIDPVEAGRYVYKGADPDNYIWLDLNGDSTKTDNETYRIVTVESDNTIKVVADTSIGYIVFDPGYSTAIDGVTSASSMEGTRWSSTSTDYCYYSTSTTSYNGCNVWGSSTTMLDSSGNNITVMPRQAGSTTTYTLPTNEAYLNTYLNTTFLNSIDADLQNKIATHTYNVGPLALTSGQTLDTDITQESAYKWKGRIGLINPTDYVRASTNSSCTSVKAYESTSACYESSDTHNYLFHSGYYMWMMNPYSSSSSDRVWHGDGGGHIRKDLAYLSGRRVAPVLFLKSNITLSGSGSSGDPYVITG